MQTVYVVRSKQPDILFTTRELAEKYAHTLQPSMLPEEINVFEQRVFDSVDEAKHPPPR